jgi:hypothetical protein
MRCKATRQRRAIEVALQHVRKAARQLLRAIQRGVRPLADAAGVRVVDKAPLENWLDDLAEGVMHQAVTERRGRNQTRLGIVDVKIVVRPRTIRLRLQFYLQCEQIFFQVVLECRDVGVFAFAARSVFERKPQIFKRGDLWIQVFESLHIEAASKKIFSGWGKRSFPQTPFLETSFQHPASRNQNAGIEPGEHNRKPR